MNVPSSTPSETADEPIDELQQLEPDDFVDERRAAGADEQHQQGRQPCGRSPAIRRREWDFLQ